jgi:hypothetical protein
MIAFEGREYPLLLNGNAYFKLIGLFGDNDVIGGLMACDFERVCEAAAILAEQAELDRRADGYGDLPFLDGARLAVKSGVAQAFAVKSAVMQAAIDGFEREKLDENEEIDLSLAELNKKKE